MTDPLKQYDEAEDLTAEMVREWLRAKWWIADDQRSLAQWWIAPDDVPHQVGGVWIANDDNPDQWQLMEGPLRVVARAHELSLQSLLREINPRMRPGWPTDEELQRHAWWLIHSPGLGMRRVTSSSINQRSPTADRSSVTCWPCDAHGNKVRRGAR